MNFSQFNPVSLENFFANPFAASPLAKSQGISLEVNAGRFGSGHHNVESTVSRHLDRTLGQRVADPVFSRGHHDGRGGAHKILAHVREALKAAPDNGARSELLGKAREGIQQGIAEARQQLEESGLLDERMAKRIDAMERHLTRGLDRLARHYGLENAGLKEKGVEETGDQLILSSAQMNLAVAQFEQRSASVQIETQEGDIITLDFNRSAGEAQAFSAQSSDGLFAVAAASGRYVDASLSYSVQGDINEEEQAAIDELIKNASKVAEHFFGDQLEAAFHKAAELSLDTETLSRFSMNLEKTSVQVALGSYQSVAAMQEPVAEVPPVEAGVSDAVAAVGEVRDLLENAEQQGVMADPQTALPQLLAGIAQAKGFDVEKITELFQRLRELVESLSSIVQPVQPLSADAETSPLNPAV